MNPVDDELPELYPSAPSHNSHFFNHLLGDISVERPFLFNQLPQIIKNEEHLTPQEPEVEENCQFNLQSIEVPLQPAQRQDQIRQIPQKLDMVQGEEDPLDFGLLTKKSYFDSGLLAQQPSIMNKTAYLQERREDKIKRYLEKKEHRIWYKKIAYDCRKVVADQRERKNGRFVKKEEQNQDGSSSKKYSRETGEGECPEESIGFKVQDYYK